MLAWSAHLRPDPLHCALPSHDDIGTSTNQAPVSELLTVWKWVDFANCRTRRGSLRIGRWRCGTTAALFIGLASLDLAFGEPDYEELRAVHFCSDPRPKRNTSESASRSNTSSRTRWALMGNLSSFRAGLGYFYSITNLGFRAASQLPYCGPHAARRTAADDRYVDPRRCSVC